MSLLQLLDKARKQVGPIRIVGTVDWFKLRDAPYTMEERVSDSGYSYERKVYLPEAYTAQYMEPSDETGRLVRWGIKLSDGRMVSRDGALRIRFPEQWSKIKGRLDRLRGQRRMEVAASELWKRIDEVERQAMIDGLQLGQYVDERGIAQAKRDLLSDLKEQGSLLYFLRDELQLDQLLSSAYSHKYLGDDVGTIRWASAPWERWVRYKLARHGLPVRDVGVEELPLVRSVGAGRVGPHPWWGALKEYVANARGPRRREVPQIRARIEARIGGPVPDWSETERMPSRPDLRREAMARIDARVARMSPADQRALSGSTKYTVLPGILRSVWSAFGGSVR